MARIVAISDVCAPFPVEPPTIEYSDYRARWRRRRLERASGGPGRPEVRGGHLERLPLAAVRHGLCDQAEVWSFHGRDEVAEAEGAGPEAGLIRRRFRADGPAPYPSADLLAHIDVFGAPDILCVWGLGVDPAILARAEESVRVYTSLGSRPLRIPEEVSRHIDLFLVSDAWQEDVIRARHPDALVAAMPIGPEFASSESFFPTGVAKDIDVIYVAAAEPEKRHDILLDAFAKLPPGLRGLCLFDGGPDIGAIRGEIARRGLNILCAAGPRSPRAEMNAVINRARIGVVCSDADAAPAVLTEYMLAGLPVLANTALACGLHYIRPDTGMTASAERFHEAIPTLLAWAPGMAPRDVVLDHWVWQRTIVGFARKVAEARRRKSGGGRERSAWLSPGEPTDGASRA